MESLEPDPLRRPASAVRSVALRAKSAVGACHRRLHDAHPYQVVVPLIGAQWTLATVVALAVGHSGSLALAVPQVLILGPAGLIVVYEIALRLAGRVFAAWAAFVWVVLPFAVLLYATPSLRHPYAHSGLLQVIGLSGDTRLAATVAFGLATYFAIRAVETGAYLHACAMVAAAAAGGALAPREALVAVAPLAVLVLSNRRRLAIAATVALAACLGGVAAAVGAGALSGPFGRIGWTDPGNALAGLSENLWSGRVLEWLAIAGIAGTLRRSPRIGAALGIAYAAALLSVGGARVPLDRNVLLLHALLPAWFAVVLVVAAIPLLAPRATTSEGRTATVSLRRFWERINRPAFPHATVVRDDGRAVATPLWASVSICALFTVVLGIGLWNATRYPVMLGYDAQEHIAYADGLISHGTTPTVAAGGEYYAPPGYYAVAGAATWVGRQIGMSEPHQAAQYLNVVFVLLTAALLLILARLLFPRKPGVWVAALGFFSFLPVVAKTAAMFHPETLNMLTSTAAVTLATWMLLRRRFSLRWLGLLALALAADQLVRASSLFTFAAVAIAFLAALATPSVRAHMPLRRIGLAAAAFVLVAIPWYVERVAAHKTQPGVSLSSLHFTEGQHGGAPFFGLSLDDVLNRPVRPFYKNEALPETYTEIWGDWSGNFAWSGYSSGPSPEALTVLKDQSSIGALPTLLAIVGWLALALLGLRRRLDRISLLPLMLLPVIAVGAYLWRGYVLPSPDGDLMKASYLLTTVPAWALGFGFAVERISQRRLLMVGLAVALLVFGVLELRFMLYGVRDHRPIF